MELNYEYVACFLRNLGCNSIRRGNAAKVGAEMRSVLARYNKLHDRSQGSTIDLDVYCPRDILFSSGPLFADSESIQERWEAFVAQKVTSDKLNIYKCTLCGYPNCDCVTCISILNARASGKKTKAKARHDCALQHAPRGAPPSCGFYNEELTSSLALAWNDVGVLDAPAFKKLAGGCGYYWPEELN